MITFVFHVAVFVVLIMNFVVIPELRLQSKCVGTNCALVDQLPDVRFSVFQEIV